MRAGRAVSDREQAHPKTIWCATSRLCQYSSGLKYVQTATAWSDRQAKIAPHSRPSSRSGAAAIRAALGG